jgi:Anti-sigma regulatory factor (Ser/Thr protein kinase)
MACLRLCLAPHPGAVREALATLRAWLAGADVPAEARDRCELVLAELLNNVVEHARPASPVRLIVAPGAGGRLCIALSDGGRPMPGLRLPPPHLPALNVAASALPEGGFGWPLVHRLATRLRYRRHRGRNWLCLVLPPRVAPAEPGAR